MLLFLLTLQVASHLGDCQGDQLRLVAIGEAGSALGHHSGGWEALLGSCWLGCDPVSWTRELSGDLKIRRLKAMMSTLWLMQIVDVAPHPPDMTEAVAVTDSSELAGTASMSISNSKCRTD